MSQQTLPPTPPDSPIEFIPLECIRCRKQKTLCGGQSFGGTGCSNCQDQALPCVFLRVRCESRALVPNHVLVLVSSERKSVDQIILRPHQPAGSTTVRPQVYAGVYNQEQPEYSWSTVRDLGQFHNVRVPFGSKPDYYTDVPQPDNN